MDNIVFINDSIFRNSFLEQFLSSNMTNSFIIIANSLLIGFVIYYCFRLLFAHYTSTQIEKPYQFIFKVIIFAICINSSYFLCEQIVQINSYISGSICDISSNILGTEVSFSNLVSKLNFIIAIEENSFTIFSIDGILKSFITIGLFNLLLSYCLRYVMIKVFILITPFAILCLCNNSSTWFFKSWLRTFASLLLLQSLTAIILAIIFTTNYSSHDILSKFLFIGGIYALIRANSYLRTLIGGITTDISSNFNSYIRR